MKASFSLTLMPCAAITDPDLSNTRKYLRSEPDCGSISTLSALLPFHSWYRSLIASTMEIIIEIEFIQTGFPLLSQLPACQHQQICLRYDHSQLFFYLQPGRGIHQPKKISLPVSSTK